MPVQLLKKINPNLTISVWQIAEEIDELRSDININKQEEQELELIHHTRGKKQWLAARNLIKHTLNAEQHVVYNDLGVPFLDGQKANISLSHSGNRVAFACNIKEETGIDIQQYNEKIFNIASKFMNQFELNWVNDHKDKRHYLHLLWNFKESIFKYYTTQMPFKSVEIQPFEFSGEGWVKAVRKLEGNSQYFHMRYFTFDDYYLGFLVEKL